MSRRSLNISVTQPSGQGFLRLGAGCLPPLTVALNFNAGQTRSNNAQLGISASGVLPASASVVGGGTVHLVVDVNGFG